MYTAAALFEWQKKASARRNVFIIAPIILGGIASSQIFSDGDGIYRIVAAVLALVAGFFPAIFKALEMDMRVEEIGRSAAEFTNLRDRFRQIGHIHTYASYEEVQARFETLMDNMDAARKGAPAVPDRYFERARKRIKGGVYNYQADVD